MVVLRMHEKYFVKQKKCEDEQHSALAGFGFPGKVYNDGCEYEQEET
jgi:hypothetical protein